MLCLTVSKPACGGCGLSEGPSQPIRSGREGVLRGNRVIEPLPPRPFGCTRPDIIGPPLCVLDAWRAPSMSSAKESPARGGAWVGMMGCRRASPPPCHAFGEPGSPLGLPRSRHERRGRAPQANPLLCNPQSTASSTNKALYRKRCGRSRPHREIPSRPLSLSASEAKRQRIVNAIAIP